jgi:hypothetical protein
LPTGFLKSRVYAKLLMRLISERYQTFNRQWKGSNRTPHDTEAYQIGKSTILCAFAGVRAASAMECASVKGG